MHRGRCAARSSRDREGFTLVEVLVALLLASVGLLALAATGALVAREVGATTAATSAALLARNRIETFATTACDVSSAAGSDQLASARGRWRVVRRGTLVSLTDTVIVPDPRGERTLVVHSAAAC